MLSALAYTSCMLGVQKLAPEGSIVTFGHELTVLPNGELRDAFTVRVNAHGKVYEHAGTNVQDAVMAVLSEMMESDQVMDKVVAKIQKVINGELPLKAEARQ